LPPTLNIRSTTVAQQTPNVPVPANTDLAYEPALTIGELFANKATLKALIVAVVGALVAIGVNVPDGLADNVVTILNIVVPIVVALYGGAQLRAQAKAQAAKTREAVYAPATVKQLVDEAATNA